MKLALLALTLFVSMTCNADDFDKLLEKVKSSSRLELAEDKQRLNKFANEKASRDATLKAAMLELDELKTTSSALNKQLDDNDQKISELEQKLHKKAGDLGELFGVIRQVAGEVNAELQDSLTSTELGNRKVFLQELSQSKELPNSEKLKHLWHLLLEEMGESGKTRHTEQNITLTNGTISPLPVTRIGAFALLSGERYLLHNSANNTVSELQRQPRQEYLKLLAEFSGSNTSMAEVMIDPTRGQLLNMLTLKPSYIERIRQGGPIGYIILSLGALGLLLSLARYLWLGLVSMKIKRQSKTLQTPKSSNPLGRIALSYSAHAGKEYAERETLIEDAMMKEISPLTKFNSLIKLLATVSPLLGLLGTVIGMIITFQSISLFGTSDPKLMAGGISTALVTTVLGLSVAIPLLFAHTLLVAKSTRLIEVLENQSIGLIERSH